MHPVQVTAEYALREESAAELPDASGDLPSGERDTPRRTQVILHPIPRARRNTVVALRDKPRNTNAIARHVCTVLYGDFPQVSPT